MDALAKLMVIDYAQSEVKKMRETEGDKVHKQVYNNFSESEQRVNDYRKEHPFTLEDLDEVLPKIFKEEYVNLIVLDKILEDFEKEKTNLMLEMLKDINIDAFNLLKNKNDR